MKRRGFTLLEMEVAGLVAFVVMGIATATLALVLRHNDRQRQSPLAWSRLADQLRRDFHQAERIEPAAVEGAAERAADDGAEEFSISIGTRQITYRREGDTLLRISTGDKDPAAREAFQLPVGAVLRWEQLPKIRGELATLAIDYPLGHGPAAKRREVIVSALVARDLRWSQ